jgi:hypothetical protein
MNLNKKWYEVYPTEEICGVGSRITTSLRDAMREAEFMRGYCQVKILRITQEEVKTCPKKERGGSVSRSR